MPKPLLHVGDEGVRFLCRLYTRDKTGARVVQDLTGVSGVAAKWRKEDGSVVEGPASVYGDPAGGWVLAVSPAGLLDHAGTGWALQIEVAGLGSFGGHTSKGAFEVDHAFEAA